MNRKNLTAAVLAGLAGAVGIVGTAQSGGHTLAPWVSMNPDGLGQVLIYPYYTTNGGNTTLLSVVNTNSHATAVKVRFLEGQNSREVLDFNLYMSEYDVWTASIKNIDGTPTMKTADTSCTVPYIYDWDHDPDTTEWTDAFGTVHVDGKQPFLPYALDDGGSSDIARAREGHFEMIEMGVLTGTTAPGKNDDEAGHSAWAATHTLAGIPADCSRLTAAWSDPSNLVQGDEGYWLNETENDIPNLLDIEHPMGGLFGGAALVNVQAGVMTSYDAKAINGWAQVRDPLEKPLHTFPGSVDPNLDSGDVFTAAVFMDDGTVQIMGEEEDGATAPYARSVDAVSFVFMRDQVMNEYTTEIAVAAGTEWVMSFPTKQFYVYQDQAGAAPEYPVPVQPFTDAWDGEGACEIVSVNKLWDREEQTFTPEGEEGPPIVSPRPPGTITEIPTFELCYEVSVIEFGPKEGLDESAMLGSTNFHEIDNATDLMFEYGWARLDMATFEEDVNDDGQIANTETFTRLNLPGDYEGLLGLPVTGFSVQGFINNSLKEGVKANYAGIFQHKYTRRMGSGNVEATVYVPPKTAD